MLNASMIFIVNLKRHMTTGRIPRVVYTNGIKRKKIFKLYDALKTIGIFPKDVAKAVQKVSACKIHEENIEIFKELNIAPHPTKSAISCLKLNSNVLYNRGYLLRELGVSTLKAKYIMRIQHFTRTPEAKFKNKMQITRDESISEILYNYLRQEYPSMPCTFQQSKEDELVYDIYKYYFQQYESWLLNLQDGESIMYRNNFYQSFKLFERLLDVLRKDLKCEDAIMLKRRNLLRMDTKRVIRFLNHFKNRTIAGLSPSETIIRYPQIVNQELDNIDQVLRLAKKYNITDFMIQKYMFVLTLQKDILKKRILYLKNIPECEIWMDHPSFLRMLHRVDTISNRVEYLRLIGFSEWSNYGILTCKDVKFNKYADTGFPTMSHFHIIAYLLKKHLKELRPGYKQKIIQNPGWKHVPPLSIHHTLSYITKHFSVDDIYKNINIILYSRDTVSTILETVKQDYQQYNFTPCQTLAMSIYLLEKDNYFMGSSTLLEAYHERVQQEVQNKIITVTEESINEKLSNVLFQRCKIHNSF